MILSAIFTVKGTACNFVCTYNLYSPVAIPLKNEPFTVSIRVCTSYAYSFADAYFPSTETPISSDSPLREKSRTNADFAPESFSLICVSYSAEIVSFVFNFTVNGCDAPPFEVAITAHSVPFSTVLSMANSPVTGFNETPRSSFSIE